MRTLLCLIAVFLLAAVPAGAEIVINMPGSQYNPQGSAPNVVAQPQPHSAQQIPPAGIPSGQPQTNMPQTNMPQQKSPQPYVPPVACTQMWCQEGVTIVLPPMNTPGQYRFVVTADNQRYSCQGRLPLAPCGQNSVTCDRPGLVVQESGCALPASAHSFYALFLNVVPKTIEVGIQMPGQNPISFAGPTNANCFYPNGAQCDPRPCCQAQINILP